MPRVWDAFGTASTTRELWEFVARRLETDSRGDASTCASTLRGADVALGNVLQPVKTHIDCLTPRLACVVARAATRLMSSPHSSAALFLASESDGGVEAQDDDDDDDAQGDETARGRSNRTLEETASGQDDARVRGGGGRCGRVRRRARRRRGIEDRRRARERCVMGDERRESEAMG